MKNIQILIVEDSLTQAEELKFILESHAMHVAHALNAEKAIELLKSSSPNIIISDIVMPGMDGYQLCQLVKSNPDKKNIPFILLTSLADGKAVIKGLECGADSFLTKPFNEGFLLSRIQYFLKNAELRISQSTSSIPEILFQNEKFAINSTPKQILDILLSTYEDSILKNNELIESNKNLKIVQDKLSKLNENLEQIIKLRTKELEESNEKLLLEIEERKRTSNALIEKAQLLANAEKLSQLGSWRFNLVDGTITWSDEMYVIFGIDQETVSENIFDLFMNSIHPDDKEAVFKVTQATLRDGISRPMDYRIIRPNGDVRWVHAEGEPITNERGKNIEQLGTLQDITERRIAEEEIIASEDRYRTLFTEMLEGFALHEIICDENGTPVDYRFLDVNPAFENLTGLKANEIVGKCVLEVMPNTEAFWIEAYGKVALTGESIQFEHYAGHLKKHFNVGAFRPKENQFATFFTDITERKNAEIELKESNDLNTSLIKTIPFGIDIVDEEGNILFMSENLSNAFGKNALGNKCWLLYRDDKSQCGDCPLHTGVDVGETALYETDGVLGGRTFQISHTGMLFKGRKAMLEIFQDITEQKQIERSLIRSEKELKKAQQITHIGSWYLDLETNDVIWTEELYKMYGFDPNLPPPPYSEHAKLFTPESFKLLSTSLERTRTTGIPYELELETIKEDGRNGWMWVRGETDVNTEGKVVGLWGAAQDITERKNIEIELKHAKEKAEESDRLKSAFLANMSHEVRTPLNSIIGFSDILLDGEIDVDSQIEFIKLINSSGVTLLSIISDIMDFSKIEAGHLNIDKTLFMVNTLVESIFSELTYKAQSKGIDLIISDAHKQDDCTIFNDELKVKRILSILVNNAIKFTEHGSVKIDYIITNDRIRFEVKDTGIGIAPVNCDKVFNRFWQVEDGLSRTYGGNGLGLAIARSLAEALEGKIWLDSELGVGTTFFLELAVI